MKFCIDFLFKNQRDPVQRQKECKEGLNVAPNISWVCIDYQYYTFAAIYECRLSSTNEMQ